MFPTQRTAEEIGLNDIQAYYARKERIDREWSETMVELHRRRVALWEPALTRIPQHLRRSIRFLIPRCANLTGRSVLRLLVAIHEQSRAAFIRAFHLEGREQPPDHKATFRAFVLGIVGGIGPPPPWPPWADRTSSLVVCGLAPRPPRHRLIPVLGGCVM
jgi:hypothetical protein